MSDILADAIFEKIESQLVHVSQDNAAEILTKFTGMENSLVTIQREQQALVAQLTAVDVDVHAQLNAKLDELKQQMRLMLGVFIATLVTLGVILVVVSWPVSVRKQQDAPGELGSEYCRWYADIPWDENMPQHAVQHLLSWAQCAVDSVLPRCCRPGHSCQPEQPEQ
jgi:hypothetical protein